MKRHLVEPAKPAKPAKLLDQLQAEELGAALWMTSPKQFDALVGDRVKFVRKALGLTQTELASSLGYHREIVWRWEERKMAVVRVNRLALRALVLEALVKL